MGKPKKPKPNYDPANIQKAHDLLVQALNIIEDGGCVNNPDGGCYDLEEEPEDAPCTICDAREKLNDVEGDLHSLLPKDAKKGPTS